MSKIWKITCIRDDLTNFSFYVGDEPDLHARSMRAAGFILSVIEEEMPPRGIARDPPDHE